MTGLHDRPATSEPRRSKRRPERSRPEANVAEPPARRAKRADVHAPPRKREPARVASPPHPLDGELGSEDAIAAPPPARRAEAPGPPPEREGSVPAASAARSSSPLCHDCVLKDVSITMPPPPPPAGRADAPAPPPKRKGSSAWPGTTYVLRNRRVPDAGNHKPTPPRSYERRQEIKPSRSCSSKKQLEEDEFWQAPACARKALEHYNSMNQEDEHELIKAVDVHPFVFCGMWLHANFLARRKGASNCVDLVPKYFFTELKIDQNGLSCVSCIKIDSVESKKLGGCGVCPEEILHPAVGVYNGAQPCRDLPAPGGLEISFSF